MCGLFPKAIPRKKSSLTKQESVLGLLFILPSFCGFLVLYIIPFVSSSYYCFTKGVQKKYVGFANFVDLFNSEPFRLALTNTLVFIAIGIPILMAVSFAAALLLKKSSKVLTVVVIVPLVIPSASIVSFFTIVFSQYGIVNRVLNLFRLGTIDFMNSGWAVMVYITLFVWKYFGYNTILFLTALKSIKMSYYESAKIEGATGIQVFKHITLPFCIPMSFLVFIMSFVNSFKIFREVILLFGLYPNERIYTIQHFMNNNFFNLSYQRLTTAAYLLVIIITVVVVISYKWENIVRKNLY